MGTTTCTYHVLDDPDSPLVARYTDVYNSRRVSATVDDTRRSVRSPYTPELRLVAERADADIAIGRACMPHPDIPDGHAHLMVRTVVGIDDHEAIADDLLVKLVGWLLERGAATTTIWLRSDEADVLGPDYWERYGVVEASRELVVSLDVTAAVVVPPVWSVVTLADRPDLEDEAYETYATTFPDMPMVDPHPPWTRDRWNEHVHDDPSFGLDQVMVALDDGAVVGIGIIERQLARPGVAWHAMTGTIRSHRGRGVATAIKHAQIRWARTVGLHELRTGNDETNAAMRHINERLGYAPLVVFTEYVGELEAFSRCRA